MRGNMHTLLQDLRYGARMLINNPALTLIGGITLALGIGANSTIFSYINGLVLRPIPGVKEPERLVAVYTSDYGSGIYGRSSYPDMLTSVIRLKASPSWQPTAISRLP